MTNQVRVHASSDVLTAELMRGLFESEGIFAEVKGEGAGPYRVGQCYVWVEKADEEAARAIVERVEAGSYAIEDGDHDNSLA